MPADFDAVCAQLSTPQLDAAARIEGVVWGLVKGYTSWPVSCSCKPAVHGAWRVQRRRDRCGGNP
jgi:hypothetical protein